MKSLKIILLSFVLLFAFGLVSAQETPPAEEPTGVGGGYSPAIMEAVNLDENVQPQDLEVGEPRLLPDSPFYFLKNWARKIQSFFAFNPVRKAELKLKFSNEKLIEVKKLIELKKVPEVIKRATENYQKEVEKIKEQAERIKEKVKENPRLESFLNKFIHQQTLHQKLLQRLESQAPPAAFEKIKEARERHLERFKDVMLKLEDRKEKITEKLNKILEEQKGSEFKAFKNLEVLKNLEEKVPAEAKEAIQKAQENTLKRLQENLEKMSPEDQERFKEYIEKISGEKEKHLEILENLKQGIQIIPRPTPMILKLKERLEEGKTEIIKKVKEKSEEIGCPFLVPPPGFCKEGRVIIEKDPETGCPLLPKCIIPGEIEIPLKPLLPKKPEAEPKELYHACITLWDPVCGQDGKTYSNECFAKLAEMEINYKGECKETKTIPTEPLPPEKLPIFPEQPKEMLTEGCCVPCDDLCPLESYVGCQRAIKNGICQAWKTPCPCR